MNQENTCIQLLGRRRMHILQTKSTDALIRSGNSMEIQEDIMYTSTVTEK